MDNHRPEQVNTVLFDLDDTLLDSYAAKIHALRETFLQAGISEVTAEQFVAGLQGASFKIGFQQFAESKSTNDDLLAIYRRAYWLKQQYIRLYPDIRETLEILNSRGFKLGIISSKGRDFEIDGKRVGFEYELKQLDVYDMFSAIIGLEDVNREKPDPEGIDLALSKLNSQPQETLFIGDSAVDILAARNAGSRSCLATWGINTTDDLPGNLFPDFTVKSPSDLLALDCLKR